MSDWTHESLQHDLAETRKGVGEIVSERLSIGSFGRNGQMDVFAMKPSWANPNPVVYEVKVTRQDFRGDTQTGKYRRYLPYCRRLYFAAPKGLLKKEDVPEGMGLTIRGENGWHVVKAPKVRSLPEDFHVIVFSLLLKVHPDGFSPLTRVERIRRMMEFEDIREARVRLPEKFHRLAIEARQAEDNLSNAREAVCKELGLNPDLAHPNLGSLVHEVLDRAPKAKPKGLSGVRMNLDSIVGLVNRTKNVLDRMEGVEV